MHIRFVSFLSFVLSECNWLIFLLFLVLSIDSIVFLSPEVGATLVMTATVGDTAGRQCTRRTSFTSPALVAPRATTTSMLALRCVRTRHSLRFHRGRTLYQVIQIYVVHLLIIIQLLSL